MSTMRFASKLPSPIAGVPDDQWARFVRALDVQPTKAISDSGGFGSYDMRPRRLVELGYATALQSKRSPKGRQIYTCTFLPPLSEEGFLGDPMAQYRALVRSVSLHAKDIEDGKVTKPAGMSLAGALAVLHRGGRGALSACAGGQNGLFSDTRTLLMAAQGAF